MKKLLTLFVLTLSVLFTVAAEGQELQAAFGFGTIKAPAGGLNTTNGFTYPSLSGGLYPSFSGAFITKHHHIGFGGQVAWRAHQGTYTESSFTGLYQAPFRPIFYNVDGIYGRKFNKRFGVDVMAGVGGMDLRFYTPSFTCGAFSCTNYTSTNHFAGHVGLDIRYYVWGNLFIRPEAHYYLIHNNVEFNGANAARFTMSIGYSFRPGF